jgi:hypothetical protein
MASSKTTSGTVVLMGSEGAEPEAAAFWKDVLGAQFDYIALVGIPGVKPSLVFQTRLSLIEAMISEIGIAVRRHEGIETLPPAGEGSLRTVIVLSIDTVPDARGREAFATRVKSYVEAGARLIAGATAASACGLYAIGIERPLPPNPDDVILERVQGLALVRDATILPYFDMLPEGAAEKVRRVAGMELLTIGIDQDAALIIGPKGTQCAGLGKVTLMRDNDLVWMGTGGESPPVGLISPKLNDSGETT